MFENITYSDLIICVSNRWSPKIGDPTVLAWFTVAAYTLCAFLGLAVVMRHKTTKRGLAFWLLLTVLMAFLAVNKELDLQSALTATGRCIAKAQGWYSDRRTFQRSFIFGLIASICVLLAMAVYVLRSEMRRSGIALLGLAFVCGFVAVRAVGFHHVDLLIKQSYFGIRMNGLLELTGLALIAVNAAVLLWGRRQQARN